MKRSNTSGVQLSGGEILTCYIYFSYACHPASFYEL